MRATHAAALALGDPVDIWCASTSHWASGFCVSSIDDTHVWVRRVSDGTLLPEPFVIAKVRPVR